MLCALDDFNMVTEWLPSGDYIISKFLFLIYSNVSTIYDEVDTYYNIIIINFFHILQLLKEPFSRHRRIQMRINIEV